MEENIQPATEENKRITEMIARDGLLDKILNQITNHSQDEDLSDLRQDVYVSLLSDKKLPGVYERGELLYYLARILMNNIASNTSPFYRIYKKPGKNTVPFCINLANDIYEPPRY